LDVGVAVRVPRAAFAEKHELEKMAENVEWFVFGDENPGEKVEHESETSVVFARIRRPKRGQFELPMKFRARYAKPVFQSGEEAKREVKEAKRMRARAKRIPTAKLIQVKKEKKKRKRTRRNGERRIHELYFRMSSFSRDENTIPERGPESASWK